MKDDSWGSLGGMGRKELLHLFIQLNMMPSKLLVSWTTEDNIAFARWGLQANAKMGLSRDLFQHHSNLEHEQDMLSTSSL